MRAERFIWSQNIFPQIMQFSTTINHFKPGEWSERNSSLCPPGWMRNWMERWIIKSSEISLYRFSDFARELSTFHFNSRCKPVDNHVASPQSPPNPKAFPIGSAFKEKSSTHAKWLVALVCSTFCLSKHFARQCRWRATWMLMMMLHTRDYCLKVIRTGAEVKFFH